MTTTHFAERVKRFWDWFSAHEETLSELAQNRKPDPAWAEQAIAQIDEGVSLLGDKIRFNIGGNHEFTFAVSGNHPLFFLLPYVTANLPEQFREKWTFHPCMPGTGGRCIGFQMHGAETDSDHVMVSAVRNEDGTADLQFYDEAFRKLTEEECYNAFYTLMDICIGEALAAVCIGEVKLVKKPGILPSRTKMFPLTKLESWLLDKLREGDAPPDPAQSYAVYRYEPQDGFEPRMDIFTGSTNSIHLTNSYFAGDDTYYQTLASYGAKPVFLSFLYGDDTDRNEVFQTRNTIMDMLEQAMGERGSGQESGIMLGGAMGVYRAYIDMLLYDEQAFFDKAKPLLAPYPYLFFREDFVRGGQEDLLFEYRDPGFAAL